MANPSLTVCTVLWMGDFRGRAYSPDWVRRLKNMAARNLPRHRFVCLSNVRIKGINTIPIPDDPPGWWAKINLFREPLGERCLFLDLDTLIVNDLTPLVKTKEPFIAAPHSSRWKGEGQNKQHNTVCHFSSCALSWSGSAGAEIYRYYTKDAQRRYRGDQDFMGDVMGQTPTYPAEWFLKLKECTQGPPEGVKIVASMPWKNKEAAGKFPWVKKIWR